jgi:2-polyprenyl-3-methyl-5-hydroxy-6-metoxy-1,4-benzoquinol methylase
MDRLHAALPTVAKKYIWNLKYGLLGYPEFVAPGDVVCYLSARLLKISTVLDLGCGRGSLLRALREKGWSGNYCGVDISKRSIDDARKIADQRSAWVVSDFESFHSPFYWDVIAMIESIYYVRLVELPAFLKRMIGMLHPEGTLVFRLHDREKHREHLKAVLRLYPHAESVDQSLFCISGSKRHDDQRVVTSANPPLS